MPRFIMLRRDETTGFWENTGAVVGEVAEYENKLPEHAAVEQMTRGGVYVAVPVDAWLMFEAEASVTVKPVLRHAQVAQIEEGEASLPEEERGADPLEDDDMAGMQQGPKL